jgi:hypothetical protein
MKTKTKINKSKMVCVRMTPALFDSLTNQYLQSKSHAEDVRFNEWIREILWTYVNGANSGT